MEKCFPTPDFFFSESFWLRNTVQAPKEYLNPKIVRKALSTLKVVYNAAWKVTPFIHEASDPKAKMTGGVIKQLWDIIPVTVVNKEKSYSTFLC